VEEINKAGGEAHAFHADVAIRDQVFGLVDKVVKRWGKLDVLVNNSAFSGPRGELVAETEEEVDRVLAVNYKGALWGIQAASKLLQDGGSIINISSAAARLAPLVSFVLLGGYGRLGLISFTSSLELCHVRCLESGPGGSHEGRVKGAGPEGNSSQRGLAWAHRNGDDP
jgi:NAD(P)-dependent dehydrogenase (short-subunit alcohol dehydrogenase family)